MKKRIIRVFFCTLFYSFLLHSQTLDEIIDMHTKAIGGSELIKSIKTMKVTGKYIHQGGLEMPFEQFIVTPDKARAEMKIQGMTIIQAYDGKTGWIVNQLGGEKKPEKLPENKSRVIKEYAEIEGKLVSYKKKGYSAELLGKEICEGTESYKIKITDNNNDEFGYFIDISTFLPVKQVITRHWDEQDFTAELNFSNYESTGGFVLPFSIEMKSSTGSTTVEISEVILNIQIDEKLFLMP